MTGLVFGEVLIETNKEDFDIDVDLSFKNGVYMEQPFDEMVISGLYKNGILHLDVPTPLLRKNRLGLHIDGIVPIKNNGGQVDISMQSSFSNFIFESFYIDLSQNFLTLVA